MLLHEFHALHAMRPGKPFELLCTFEVLEDLALSPPLLMDMFVHLDKDKGCVFFRGGLTNVEIIALWQRRRTTRTT
ncbi:unnamed protein product [Amoebophrya sp. A25]|nr:unnamed protein product [Amoebophrya sp. A25]|eukprot:GSA25T00000519001.1